MKKYIPILFLTLFTNTHSIGQATHSDTTLHLSSPSDYQVFQRFSEDKGTINIEGSTEKSDITSVEIKIYKKGEPADWKNIYATIKGKSFKSIYTTSSGGWYKFEIRILNNKKIIATRSVEHVGIGEVFVIAGQSNAANHGEEKQRTKTNLVSTLNGKSWQSCIDPQPGASGDGGSFIPPFADAIARQYNVPVGIVACGIGATSVREWLPKGTTFNIAPTLIERVEQLQNGAWQSKGEAYEIFINRMKELGKFGFRAVLWHQGESDANQPTERNSTLPGNLYMQYMNTLITESQKTIGWKAPWFSAMATYHVPGDEFSADIQQAQKAVWASALAMEGPNTDELKGEMRDNNGKGVHFSGKGLQKHAELWFEKISPWLTQQLANSAFSKQTPLPSSVFNVDGNVGFIIFPKKINSSTPIPWVWYAPTLPGLPGAEELWMFEQITNAGIAIVGVDVGESFGSPDGRKIFSSFYTLLTENLGFQSKAVLLGRSRGGLMTLNWAAENTKKVAAFAGIYPVCNVVSYPGINNACAAYKMTPDELTTNLSQHNPVDRLEPLAKANIPLFAIHGDIDITVPIDRNSGEVKKRYDALGGNMQLIIPEGQGHNMWEGFFKCKELIQFIKRNVD